MEFEIIKVEQQRQRISVEIEIAGTRERKKYGYPLGEGWESEIDGEPRFLKDVKKKLKEEEEISKQKTDLPKINKSLIGKRIKI